MKVLLNVNCYKRIIYNIDENINIMLYDAAYIINNIIVGRCFTRHAQCKIIRDN